MMLLLGVLIGGIWFGCSIFTWITMSDRVYIANAFGWSARLSLLDYVFILLGPITLTISYLSNKLAKK